MRIKNKINSVISTDTAGYNVLFGMADNLAETTIDVYANQVSGSFAIGQGTSEALSLGDITAVKGFYLKVDGDCKLTINSSASQIQIRKPSTTTYAYFFIEADIASLEIEAEAAVDLTGIYCAYGDLA